MRFTMSRSARIHRQPPLDLEFVIHRRIRARIRIDIQRAQNIPLLYGKFAAIVFSPPRAASFPIEGSQRVFKFHTAVDLE